MRELLLILIFIAFCFLPTSSQRTGRLNMQENMDRKALCKRNDSDWHRTFDYEKNGDTKTVHYFIISPRHFIVDSNDDWLYTAYEESLNHATRNWSEPTFEFAVLPTDAPFPVTRAFFIGEDKTGFVLFEAQFPDFKGSLCVSYEGVGSWHEVYAIRKLNNGQPETTIPEKFCEERTWTNDGQLTAVCQTNNIGKNLTDFLLLLLVKRNDESEFELLGWSKDERGETMSREVGVLYYRMEDLEGKICEFTGICKEDIPDPTTLAPTEELPDDNLEKKPVGNTSKYNSKITTKKMKKYDFVLHFNNSHGKRITFPLIALWVIVLFK